MTLAWQSVIWWPGPIGMQLWLSAVATATDSERSTPETPPSVTPPAICAGTARDDERPPTRKPSSSSARSATMSPVRWLRGSAWTMPKRAGALAIQAPLSRLNSPRSSRMVSKTR